MGTTKLQLYKRAIILCKQTPISALTDNVESRRRCDDHYDDVIAWLLEQGFWTDAMRTVEITQNTGVSPAFAYEYAHDMPSDFVKRQIVSASEFLEPPLDGNIGTQQYKIEGGYLWANVTPVYMRYVSNDSSYGGDLTKWTEGMAEAFAHKLAARVAPVLAGSDELSQELDDKAMVLAGRASTFASMQQPTEAMRIGRWAGNRFGKYVNDYKRA